MKYTIVTDLEAVSLVHIFPPVEAESIEIGGWRHGRSGVPLPSPPLLHRSAA